MNDAENVKNIIKLLRNKIRKLESENKELKRLYNHAQERIEELTKQSYLKPDIDMPDFMKDIFKMWKR